ncbi:hypothetical protein BVRB_027410, partial [Beta vulgaris subsp. vulgaris]
RWRKQPSRLHLIPLSTITTVTVVDLNEWFLRYHNEWVDLRCDHAGDWIKRLRLNYSLYCECHLNVDQPVGTGKVIESRATARRASDFVRYWQKYQDYE